MNGGVLNDVNSHICLVADLCKLVFLLRKYDMAQISHIIEYFLYVYVLAACLFRNRGITLGNILSNGIHVHVIIFSSTSCYI
jgi:hypothetical protein